MKSVYMIEFRLKEWRIDPPSFFNRLVATSNGKECGRKGDTLGLITQSTTANIFLKLWLSGFTTTDPEYQASVCQIL